MIIVFVVKSYPKNKFIGSLSTWFLISARIIGFIDNGEETVEKTVH